MIRHSCFLIDNEYRTPLLERVGRTVRLTPSGQELMPYVQAILDSAKQSCEAVEGIRNTTAGHVRIGATGLSGVHMLPELIAEFMGRCPECHIDAVPNYTLQLRRMILANDLDLGIMGGDQGRGARGARQGPRRTGVRPALMRDRLQKPLRWSTKTIPCASSSSTAAAPRSSSSCGTRRRRPSSAGA